MKLYATPKSHFSRKIRLLMDHLALDYELIDVGNVAENQPEIFSDNPVMCVPVLEDGDLWMIESDHIAAHIVRTHAPDDHFGVLTESVDRLNARAVMNSIMANEVKLILSARTRLDPRPHAYFQKAEQGIRRGMAWLEDRTHIFDHVRVSYTDFHFISMWDHLDLYGLIEMDYPALGRIATRLGARDVIKASEPPR